MIDRIKKLAYFIWRGLPPGVELDDVTSEAVLGALQAREGCEIIAAKRAIIQYLRRCYPGSRGTRRMCLVTVSWLPDGSPRQERMVIDDQLRGMILRAVETLTAKELAVIQAVFYSTETQSASADRMGTTEAYFSRVKRRAIAKLRLEMGRMIEVTR